ncbi:MAG: hypothetical protein RSE00_01240 [Clostridia bacterium]
MSQKNEEKTQEEIEEKKETAEETKINNEKKEHQLGSSNGFAVVSSILGVACIGLVWFSTILCLIVGFAGLIFALISIGQKRTTLGIMAIAINIVGLSLLLIYFIICMVMGASMFALH